MKLSPNYPNPFNRSIVRTLLLCIAMAMVCTVAVAGPVDIAKGVAGGFVAFAKGLIASPKAVIGFVANPANLWIEIGSILLLALFKAIPNKFLNGFVRKTFKGVGIAITLGASRIKALAPFWEKIVEPFLIDLVDNTLGAATTGLIEGLRSDNKPAG